MVEAVAAAAAAPPAASPALRPWLLLRPTLGAEATGAAAAAAAANAAGAAAAGTGGAADTTAAAAAAAAGSTSTSLLCTPAALRRLSNRVSSAAGDTGTERSAAQRPSRRRILWSSEVAPCRRHRACATCGGARARRRRGRGGFADRLASHQSSRQMVARRLACQGHPMRSWQGEELRGEGPSLPPAGC